MSRTGNVAEGPSVLTEAPGGRAKAQANRLQNGGGDLPGFPDHVLMLEGMAEVATAPDRAYFPGQDATELTARVEPPSGNPHPGSRKVVAPPRLTDAAHQAMLMLERSDIEHGVPVAAAPVDTALPPGEVADPENTPASSLPSSATRDAIFPAVSVGGSAERASAHLPVDARTARMAEVAVHSAVREATGNSHTGSSEQRNAPQQISSMPETRVINDGRSARSLGRADEVSVKVVRQETHFAPVQRVGPGAQIAEILETELAEADEPRAAQEVRDAQPRPATRTVIRMLSIQLQPAELGTVTIRMALEANTLELQLDAQRAATAELIRRDQGALTSLLRSAGYDVKGLIVHVADPDRTLAASGTQVQQGQQSPANPAPQSHFGGAQPDGRSGDGTGGEAQSQSRSGGRGGTATADAADTARQSHTGPPRPRGVYV
jgi:chemotaxis protein MotD